MSTLSGGPNIVTSGLVLHLDAANVKSYNSGSTVWRDLSINGNNGTLINGPTFGTQNNGVILFNENSSQYSTTSNILQFTPTQSFTMNVVFYVSSIQGDNTLTRDTSIFGRGITVGSVGIGAQKTTLGAYTIRIGSRAVSLISTSYNLTLNQIYHVCYVYDGGAQLSATTNQYMYFSGVLTTTQDITAGLGGAFDTAGYASFLNFPVPGGNGAYGSGGVFQASVYDRALTAQEILQNYNATKSRYNL